MGFRDEWRVRVGFREYKIAVDPLGRFGASSRSAAFFFLAAFRARDPDATRIALEVEPRLPGSANKEPIGRNPIASGLRSDQIRQIEQRFEWALSTGTLTVEEVVHRRVLAGIPRDLAQQIVVEGAQQDTDPALTTIDVIHLYHDDDPVQEATYELRLVDGTVRQGRLGKDGTLHEDAVPAGMAQVRFGPDARPYQVVDQTKNPEQRDTWSASDVDALIDRYGGGL